MAVKKTMNAGPHAEGHLVKRRFRDGKFMAKIAIKAPVAAKHARRRAKVDHAVEELEVIALTELEVARIEEVCARGTVITDHVWAAIANPWKAAGV